MKRAIALSGGGTKGAYELGVWKALNELNVDYQIVTGTSIGSINGALMATGDYEKAVELWSTITMEDMMEDGINLTATIEGMYDQKDAIRPFLKKYVKNKGADISPFTQFIEDLIDEDAIRRVKIDFGLVTVMFPSLKPCELAKKDIPPGMLKEYILASAAIFPLFPMHKIEEQLYLDGCYHDNLPIDLALRMGAEDIIAVDLHTTPAHGNYARRPYVTYIKPSRPLGTMMNFDRCLLTENVEMGYCDTMKIYGKFYGYFYTFTKESVSREKKAIRKFIHYLSRTDLYLTDDIPAKKLAKTGDFNRIFAVLQEHAGGKPMSREQCFVRAGEICGQILGVDRSGIYQMSEFISIVHGRLKPDKEYKDAALLTGKMNIDLAMELSELKRKHDREYVLGCIYHALRGREYSLEILQVALIAFFPEELAAAYFLLAKDKVPNAQICV